MLPPPPPPPPPNRPPPPPPRPPPTPADSPTAPPPTAAAHHRVDSHAFNPARAAGRIADPQLDTVRRRVVEGVMATVGAPDRQTQLGIGRQVYGNLDALRHLP